jgi:hypothetical protein
MAKLSRYLLSQKQLNSTVSKPDEDATLNDDTPTDDQVASKAASQKKTAKQQPKPSLAAMIKMAGRKNKQ